jgi:hypothetical protein
VELFRKAIIRTEEMVNACVEALKAPFGDGKTRTVMIFVHLPELSDDGLGGYAKEEADQLMARLLYEGLVDGIVATDSDLCYLAAITVAMLCNNWSEEGTSSRLVRRQLTRRHGGKLTLMLLTRSADGQRAVTRGGTSWYMYGYTNRFSLRRHGHEFQLCFISCSRFSVTCCEVDCVPG